MNKDTEEALAALAASRARLHGALWPEARNTDAGTPLPWHHAWRLLRVMALQALPPSWRAWGRLLLVPLGQAAAPLVRQHPAPALVLAACTGAAVVLMRPWQWNLASVASLAGPLAAWLVGREPDAPATRQDPAA